MKEAKRERPERPLILVSNDDGIDAPGLVSLVFALQDLGDIHVVAPIDEQSAVGHAITIRSPVRARSWQLVGDPQHSAAHAVTGTPADCVKIAVDKLLPRQPDLVVSGINRGPNTAVNVIYSGTVSAATEAAILGIDAIAFSLSSLEHAGLVSLDWASFNLVLGALSNTFMKLLLVFSLGHRNLFKQLLLSFLVIGAVGLVTMFLYYDLGL